MSRPWKILTVLAVISVALAVNCAVAGCNSFVGPATALDKSYLIKCGAETCDPSYWQCSPAWYPPVHCQSTLASVARDGGE